MKKIIYQNDDGGVSVIIPAPCGLTIEQIAKKDAPVGKAYLVVEADIIPTDNHFREAWEIHENSVVINMSKAVEIQKNKIREDREPLLAALDVAFMRALEIGDTVRQAEIVAEKQILRDAPDSPLLTNAITPEELKAVNLDVIKSE